MQPKTEIKMELMKRGMTQVELARKIGITPGRLNAYINGYCRMPVEIRKRIREILGGEEQSEQQ